MKVYLSGIALVICEFSYRVVIFSLRMLNISYISTCRIRMMKDACERIDKHFHNLYSLKYGCRRETIQITKLLFKQIIFYVYLYYEKSNEIISKYAEDSNIKLYIK